MNWGPLQKQTAGSTTQVARFGDFQLDLQRQELFKNGLRIKLQGKVFQALAVLIENHGEIVTREAISSRLWADGSHVNFDANVNTTVNKLRQVLGDSPERPVYVETIPRRGYSFIAKVEFVAASVKENPEPPEATHPSIVSALPSFSKLSFRGAQASKMWFALGIVALIAAGILFGAAIVVYAHHVGW